MNPFAVEPKRVTIAGDWHGNLAWAKRVVTFAVENGCDGILHLGDLGIWPGRSGQKFLDSLEKALANAGIWCAFIDGNHEDFWQLYALPLDEETGLRPVRERLWHIPRGFRWQWAGLTWLGMGGATSLDRHMRRVGVDWWPEEHITRAQFEEVIAGGRADVMLVHDCPATVPIPGLSPHGWRESALDIARKHREILLEIVKVVQPARLWHGHMHVRYRAEVTFAGTPCVVNGLGRDGSDLLENVVILDVT